MSFTLAYYPGETTTIPNEMGIENLVYTIIDNSSAVSPLGINITKTNITISFPQDMTPDSFTIIFLEEQTHEVVQTVYSGGGGHRTVYVDRNVTVPQPVFYDRNITKEVEVEKVVDNIIVEETGFEMWHILLAMIVGGLCCWFVMRSEREEE